VDICAELVNGNRTQLHPYAYDFMQCNNSPEFSWIEPLADGHLGTLRTLQTMAWLARKDSSCSDVRSTITNLLQRQPALPPVAVLFQFSRDSIRYVPDPPDIEKVSDFRHTTEGREGDCDDKVTWLATALLSLNIPVRFVVQSYAGDDWNHVYLEFWDAGSWRWIAADPTADGHTGFVADLGWRQGLPANGKEMAYEV